MKITGIRFFVEGEYVEEDAYNSDPGVDPQDQPWEPFCNRAIHPFGKSFFTIWSHRSHSPDAAEIAQLTAQAVTIINWLVDARGWRGFCATLWRLVLLYNGERGWDQQVYRWDLP